jgi:hypothetical protein
MELLEGQTLQDRVRSNQKPPDRPSTNASPDDRQACLELRAAAT